MGILTVLYVVASILSVRVVYLNFKKDLGLPRSFRAGMYFCALIPLTNLFMWMLMRVNLRTQN